jgi:hypothetical protein
MPDYIVQHRLHTLVSFWTNFEVGKYPFFTLDDIKFSNWDFNLADGPKTDFCLLEAEMEASSLGDALSMFYKKINPIISRMTFVSQCYSEHLNEPYLIQKKGSNIALFKYAKESRGISLHFDDGEGLALNILMSNKSIGDEFFYYWNDAINTTSYSAKLLLFCSALESLEKSDFGKRYNKFILRTEILGEELKNKLWERNDKGIRHRLIHGEYFDKDTDKDDYVDQIYKKVTGYFNTKIFEKDLIHDVKNPQRHPYGNKWGGHYFIKRTEESPVYNLKDMISGCDQDFQGYIDKFDFLSESERESEL